MKEKDKSVYIKRTQKDYSLSLKLQVLNKILCHRQIETDISSAGEQLIRDKFDD